jgi:heme oxygenase
VDICPSGRFHPGFLRLKSETRPHHERAERTVRLLEPGLTLEDYRRHLEALHGLFAPLEAELARMLSGLPRELRAIERWKLSHVSSAERFPAALVPVN